jgi:hypothetical protein
VVGSLVSYGGYSNTVGIKSLVVMSLLCVIFHKELLIKSCGLAYIVVILYVGLASLLKWVTPVFLTSRLCEYLTYRLILLISVASIPVPYLDPMDVYVNYNEGLKHFVPCLGKTLNC